MIKSSKFHPVPMPLVGDSCTITCYVCGMPSSKEWAETVRSRPGTLTKPYFPFLLQLSPPPQGAILAADGTTLLCAFCSASLESQWRIYESQQVVPPPNRKYMTQKFICAVCGVETYRKRIRALPFQEFPFLERRRQPGSITIGNNPLAAVCLDCSETLWSQSGEYDRWGLPVQKRHFNWMARPPPPENSLEATVARLPSGETQLPRRPLVGGATLTPSQLQGTAVNTKAFSSLKSHYTTNTSITSSNSQSQRPPVVPVAPISTSMNSGQTFPASPYTHPYYGVGANSNHAASTPGTSATTFPYYYGANQCAYSAPPTRLLENWYWQLPPLPMSLGYLPYATIGLHNSLQSSESIDAPVASEIRSSAVGTTELQSPPLEINEFSISTQSPPPVPEVSVSTPEVTQKDQSKGNEMCVQEYPNPKKRRWRWQDPENNDNDNTVHLAKYLKEEVQGADNDQVAEKKRTGSLYKDPDDSEKRSSVIIRCLSNEPPPFQMEDDRVRGQLFSSPCFVPEPVMGSCRHKIDKIVQYSSTFWQNMTHSMDDILTEEVKEDSKMTLECKALQVGALRMLLKSHMLNMEDMEKRLYDHDN